MGEPAQALVGLVVIALGFAAAISYPGLQYAAIRQMPGAWRALSFVPLAAMAIVAVYTVMALVEGSNLWPLLLIFTAPLATGYLLLLRFAARWFGRGM
jgi:hypothetical protein